MTGYAVTVQDAEFTPADRQAALEWKAEDDLRCSGCGQPRDESMRPEVVEGKPNPALIEYDARAMRCQACLAHTSTARAKAGLEDTDPLAGVHWRVEQTRGE